MLLIRLRNLSSKFLLLFFINFTLATTAMGEESLDIWNKEKLKKDKENINITEQEEKESNIDLSKIKNQSNDDIQILNKQDPEIKDKESEIRLVGLYDPEENDLRLDMWSTTDGKIIKETLKRIEKIQLSEFSENIFTNTILTYSYPPKNNFSENDFLKLKLNWLIKRNKTDLIEDFLNKNIEFKEKSRLIKHLVDFYIASADILEGCKKADFIDKEIKDNYLEKFRIYCLILNKKNEEAQLNFDLLREEGRSDKFFNNKILFLLGFNEKSDNKISDKNLLYFYLSSVTVENFKYEPTEKTDKNIWRYLTASNLITIEKLEDPQTISKYEVAANQGTFDKKKIFEIYLSTPFNITQLINADTAYKGLDGYQARALIYQKVLLSDNIERKLDLLFILKDLFQKDKLNNVFKEYLSDSLKNIDPDEIPDEFEKVVKKNIILEDSNKPSKIKYDDKVLHRSRATKIFTEEEPNKEKINKDFLKIYKKISKNKKYFFSIKDVILLETLSNDGLEMPKDLNIQGLSKNLTVPSNIDSLIENGEIGMLMLKLVEIIGSDEIEDLDPETLYFIVNLLNKAKIKKVRNEILNLTLPLRV